MQINSTVKAIDSFFVSRTASFAARIYKNFLMGADFRERELLLGLLTKMHHPDASIVYCDHCLNRATPPTFFPEED